MSVLITLVNSWLVVTKDIAISYNALLICSTIQICCSVIAGVVSSLGADVK